jgi:hypothetical protein
MYVGFLSKFCKRTLAWVISSHWLSGSTSTKKDMFKRSVFHGTWVIHLNSSYIMGGIAVGAFASNLCGPWFDSRTRGHIWVELFVGPLPCFNGFSLCSLVFLPPQKNQHFYIPTWIQWIKSHSVEMPLQIAIYLLIIYLLCTFHCDPYRMLIIFDLYRCRT